MRSDNVSDSVWGFGDLVGQFQFTTQRVFPISPLGTALSTPAAAKPI
jgi:hypothetical protein